MIFTDWSGVAFRVHDPRWAYDPLSGKGAATHGCSDPLCLMGRIWFCSQIFLPILI